MTSSAPVGIFDSGLGGVSVAREIRKRLPDEALLYVADSAYVPYGRRSLEEIRERSMVITRSLVEAGAKLIVVACNSASGAALELLREHFSMPIVGLEPAVKPAAAETRSGHIAVLATPATLRTDRFNRLVDNHGAGAELMKIPCPGFVELVESGCLEGEGAAETVRTVLEPILGTNVDRVVLGCTHYPFLRDTIAGVLGSGVEILDSGSAVARQVDRVLTEHDLKASGPGGDVTFWTTGEPEVVEPVVRRLWGEKVSVGKALA